MPPARALLYAASLAAVIAGARALVSDPLPIELVVLASLAYLTLVLLGVFVLGLRLYADALIRGPRGVRGVALTFDDGPDPAHTPAVLDALDKANAKATFFVIGRKAELHPDVVREIVRRGHTVGVHSYEHDRLFSLRGGARVRRDLEKAVLLLTKITGERPSLFRPPIGHTNPIIARVADALELEVVGWSVSGRDGVRADPERVVARVRAGLRDGAIVLLHDAAENEDHEPAGPRALVGVLDAIAAARLEVVPLAYFMK